MPAACKLFVNLAVQDLPRAKRFFEGLGFSFNPKFEDATGACLVLGEDNYAMLLTRPRFESFTRKKAADTTSAQEALIALSCADRAEVDGLMDKALGLGGVEAMPAQDHGFVYGRSVYDLDGHHWEFFWMDPKAAQ